MPTSAPQPDADGRQHGWFWIGLVLTLLGGQIFAVLVMVYIVTSDGSFAVEPNYYQQGLHWDDTANQLRKNAELGWQVRLEFGDTVSVRSERTVRCTLTDRTGQPLDGATIDVLAFPHARGSERTLVTCTPAGHGNYEATLVLRRSGVWEFRVAVRRGPETFTCTAIRDVYPPERTGASDATIGQRGHLKSDGPHRPGTS